MARLMIHKERPGHSLSPSDLAQEAILRLIDQGVLIKSENRHFFFASAARSMTQVLVDHARRRNTMKRGGRWKRAMDGCLEYMEEKLGSSFLDFIDELDELEKIHPRLREIVDLRFVVGLGEEDTAFIVERSVEDFGAEWSFIQAWFKRRLKRRSRRGDERHARGEDSPPVSESEDA
jgi:RNA polymerase sigma factor (TIGR02999 family)